MAAVRDVRLCYHDEVMPALNTPAFRRKRVRIPIKFFTLPIITVLQLLQTHPSNPSIEQVLTPKPLILHLVIGAPCHAKISCRRFSIPILNISSLFFVFFVSLSFDFTQEITRRLN
jgi:hypothetical protein